MTASAAYGYILLSSLTTVVLVWLAAWRYFGRAQRLPEHDAYCRGFDACNRIRDREESIARKETLLSRTRDNVTDLRDYKRDNVSR